MDAVSADQDIAFGLALVFEAQQHRIARGMNPNASLIKLDCVGRKRAAQIRMQVRALHLIEGRAEALETGFARRRFEEHAPAAPAPPDMMLGHCAEARNPVLELEGAQHLHGVWTKLDTGADITERARLLVHRGPEAGSAHRDRGNDPAEPGADDGDTQVVIAPPTSRGRS
jgi:hypothetical protein